MNVEKVNSHIVEWLKTYAKNAGSKGYVIGVSGGIDSAVTSTLCAQTGLRVLCLEMPILQNLDQVSLVKEHIEQLIKRFDNVTYIKTDLTQIFENFKKQMPVIENFDKVNLTLGNTRSRLRMTTLYYFGGIYGLLVAGTGNKVEDFGVGFYTKYGDGGVDVSPIADLLKSEVYQLGNFLKIPLNILNAAPTDGLFLDSRTDEDQIGASYDELEWAMKQTSNDKIIKKFSDREKEIFDIYKKLNQANQHKMLPIPICIVDKS